MRGKPTIRGRGPPRSICLAGGAGRRRLVGEDAVRFRGALALTSLSSLNDVDAARGPRNPTPAYCSVKGSVVIGPRSYKCVTAHRKPRPQSPGTSLVSCQARPILDERF